MSVSSVTNTSSAIQTKPTSNAVASNARAIDGDYKTPGPGRSAVKDADGDYKAVAPTAARTSSSVQAALTGLKLGG